MFFHTFFFTATGRTTLVLAGQAADKAHKHFASGYGDHLSLPDTPAVPCSALPSDMDLKGCYGSISGSMLIKPTSEPAPKQNSAGTRWGLTFLVSAPQTRQRVWPKNYKLINKVLIISNYYFLILLVMKNGRGCEKPLVLVSFFFVPLWFCFHHFHLELQSYISLDKPTMPELHGHQLDWTPGAFPFWTQYEASWERDCTQLDYGFALLDLGTSKVRRQLAGIARKTELADESSDMYAARVVLHLKELAVQHVVNKWAKAS